MAVYNPKSLKAEEFINDGEILATIAYAEENKNDEDSDWTISKFNNMIWYGTEAAIKATY